MGRAKAVRALEEARQAGGCPCSGGTELSDEVKAVIENIKKAFPDMDAKKTAVGSTIYAVKPGMVLPVNRLLHVRRYLADGPILLKAMQQSVIVPT